MKVRDVPVSGPRDAVERAWRNDGARLWRSLVAFGGDPELASDAIAEAFAQALGRGAEVEAPDRWIWRAAFRIAVRELKERRRVAASDVLRTSVDMPEPVAAAGSPLWSPDGTQIAFARVTPDEEVWLVTNADGTGDAREIDELRYLSWRGGWYFCHCYG